MSTLRDRGSVGRRLWRRRRRKSGSTAPGSAGTGPAVDAADKEPRIDIDVEEELPSLPVPPAAPRGLVAALKRAFARKGNNTRNGNSHDRPRDVVKPVKPAKQKPPEPAYLVVDPTRDVLAVPRGAARLDAFERAIRTTPPGTPQFRALALAFHKELQALAESAGVDLSLYETRVEACAKALILAGEDERAGTLFLRVGRRHQAAELFVAAGAIDALEEAHAQIHWDEGGQKLDARMSFDRFEALFLVGMREQAFDALERAHKLWGDNPIYSEIYASFTERLGKPRRIVLTSGSQELTVVAGWPIVIGRGEDAALRLTSPLISRAHLKIELVDGQPVVVDLESRGGTRIGSERLAGRQPLPDGAAIDMGGVVVNTGRSAAALWLTPALAPDRRTIAAFAPSIEVPNPDVVIRHGAHVILRFDAKGRAVLDPPGQLNGEGLKKQTILLEGDRIGAATELTPQRPMQWTVARRS